MRILTLHWYVAVANSPAFRGGQSGLSICGASNFSIYLPRYLKQRRHARLQRIYQIARRFFPGYLFVAVDMAKQRWLSIDS